MFLNTYEMCIVMVPDQNRKEGCRNVDLGNFFKDETGQKVLITSRELAEKYSKFVNTPVFIRTKSEK